VLHGVHVVVVAQAPPVNPKRYSIVFQPGAFFAYPVGGGRYRDEFPKRGARSHAGRRKA
jgi:hypothetical protein